MLVLDDYNSVVFALLTAVHSRTPQDRTTEQQSDQPSPSPVCGNKTLTLRFSRYETIEESDLVILLISDSAMASNHEKVFSKLKKVWYGIAQTVVQG